MFTKKNILLICVLCSIPFFAIVLLAYTNIGNLCYENKICAVAMGSATPLIGVILFFPSCLLFSAITYFMNEHISRTWIRFICFWALPYILLSTLTPNDNGYGGMLISTPSTRGMVTFFGLVSFFIISTVIIVWKSIVLRSHAK